MLYAMLSMEPIQVIDFILEQKSQSNLLIYYPFLAHLILFQNLAFELELLNRKDQGFV